MMHRQTIELDTDQAGMMELTLVRLAAGGGASKWIARGRDGHGRLFQESFDRFEELSAYLRALDDVGIPRVHVVT